MSRPVLRVLKLTKIHSTLNSYAATQPRRAGCDQNLICSLPPIALGVIALPAKARLRIVDTQRIFKKIAAQIHGLGER